MSGEFGSCMGGYLHRQMEYAAEDLAQGRLPSTRIWVPLFKELHAVTQGICWAEACDTGEAASIMTALERLPEIEKAIAEIRVFYRPYSEVAERAAREAIEGINTQPLD